jgi:DNA-binding SARP family transcriptional activator
MMAELFIQMFGKFKVYIGGSCVECFHSQKALDLLCFLLLNHDHPHHRDQLADLFWGDRCTAEAKKYFRKTLWQLQTVFEQLPYPACKELVNVDSDWLQFNRIDGVCLDILEFEEIYQALAGVRGRNLNQQDFRMVQRAVDLYKGDLLEGCYHDWCIYERERLKDMYFALVEKLMGYCEFNNRYEAGIVYGRKLLGLDHARESTHLRLIRLYYLSGDRTGALRQYELCRQALRQDFDVEPGSQTMEVYRQIKEDRVSFLGEASGIPDHMDGSIDTNIDEILKKIKNLLTLQNAIPQQILMEIQRLEEIINNKK